MSRRMTVFLATVFVFTAAALLIDRLPPRIPTTAAATPVARATLGEVPQGGFGVACLDRLTWGSGWADLCWQASREPQEADPEKDYYLLRFYGSFEGLRWLVVHSDLVGEPGDGVFDGWPTGTFTGPCQDVPVDMMVPLQPIGTETLCGHLTAGPDAGPGSSWSQRVTWTCERCLLSDDATRPISLYTEVGVPEGSLPVWDLFADGGS
jgi:hypothetical protein